MSVLVSLTRRLRDWELIPFIMLQLIVTIVLLRIPQVLRLIQFQSSALHLYLPFVLVVGLLPFMVARRLKELIQVQASQVELLVQIARALAPM